MSSPCLPGLPQFSPAQKQTHRNQNQPANEQRRQKQKEDDAEIGIVIGPAEDLHQPIADHRYAGGGGDRSTGQADGVVAEEQRRTHPTFTESLKHWHFIPHLKAVLAGLARLVELAPLTRAQPC